MPHRSEIPFRVEMAAEVFEKAGEPGKERRIGGIITTESADRQNEVVLQRGLDFSEFLANGWFNDNHSKATTDIVGYPIRVEKTVYNGKPAHRVEGYLIAGHEPSDKIWKLAQALQKTGRRLGFSIEGGIGRREGPDGRTIAQAKVREVAITKCFPGWTRVVGAGEDVTRQLYSGPMIELHLASGEKLSGTPNHPVLTQRGWVALGELNEAHDRVGCRRPDFVFPSSISHDVDHMPPTMEELFDFAKLSRSRRWIRLGREGEFHGDVVIGGEVDVVAIDRALGRRLHAAFVQKFGEQALPASDKQLSELSGSGAGAAFLLPSPVEAASFVGGGGEGFSFFGGSPPVAPDLFFVPRPVDALALGDIEDGYSGDSVAGRDAGRTLSQAIRFSNISLKRRAEFRGHVFNLQTAHGWYEADGIVAHNCPVNTDTGLEIIGKSMAALESEGDQYRQFRRALAAGQAVSDPGVSPGQGFPLRTESMERDRRRRRRKRLSRDQAVAFLKSRYRGMDDAAAERILDFVARRQSAGGYR